MPIDHYENFPVASLLLPRHLQKAVGQVYWFARSADDFADEGDATDEERLEKLKAYDDQLDTLSKGGPLHPDCEAVRFESLAALIRSWPLSVAHFHHLLSAFMQDVTTKRYADYPAVLDYCNRSANPVGRLMLELYRKMTPERQARSDAICSALQLINFWQDVAIDAAKDRIYLPLDDLARFGIEPGGVIAGDPGPRWSELMRFECGRARNLMLSGASLAFELPGRIGFELRLVIQGGLRILERIEAVDYDVFARRPVLGRSDWLLLLGRAITMSHHVP
jgi:squalene synthase HpnC